MEICMYMYVHRSSDVFYPICCWTSFRSRRFLMEEETPFSATIRGNKWILLFSHLLIRFFLCLFCSWIKTTAPYLKTDLVHWTIGSVLVGDGSGCTFARKNGNWQLLQTLLYQSHAYQQWQQWDLLSALVQTFVRLRQYSQNTLTIHSILTILWQYTQLWYIISEHIFLCWCVCFFLGILDISSPFILWKEDRSPSLFLFVSSTLT